MLVDMCALDAHQIQQESLIQKAMFVCASKTRRQHWASCYTGIRGQLPAVRQIAVMLAQASNHAG